MTFKDKIAVVTGGASGIGLAIVQGLIEQGAKVAVLDLSIGIAGDLRLVCDVGLDERVDAACAHISETLGVPDILIHCAAATFKGAVLDTPIADFERIMNINVYAALRLTNAFIDAMRHRRSGAILYVSSINAKFATPGQGAYAASKAALDSIVKTMALELADDGIRINTIQPASIGTPFHLAGLDASSNQDLVIAANIARHPLGRWGTPNDAAKLALFLVSSDASWITGAHYALDGGASVTRR